MKRTLFILFPLLLVLAVVGGFFVLAKHSATVSVSRVEAAKTLATSEASSPAAPTAPAAAKRLEVVRSIAGALRAPISFYGKVVDQYGQPVAGATVNYTATDKFDAPGSHYDNRSGPDGSFAITGIRGARLGVGVIKEGYYQIEGKSAAWFVPSASGDNFFLPYPSAEKPFVFVLHKMGETEPLLYFRSRRYTIPADGREVSIDLETSQERPRGHICFRTWVDVEKTKKPEGYDWRCVISVPGGGLARRKGEFNFEAPAEGYEPTIELTSATWSERWRKVIECPIFVKLPDGRFGRLELTLSFGVPSGALVHSYLNPTPGSRNLEFDEKKGIKARHP